MLKILLQEREDGNEGVHVFLQEYKDYVVYVDKLNGKNNRKSNDDTIE